MGSSRLNLIKSYRKCLIETADYKGVYDRIPVKLSSQSILSVFVLNAIKSSPNPTYGYEILTSIKETFGTDTWSPSTGSLYPIIARLRIDGLIESVKVKSNRKIRYYVITEAGEEVLAGRLIDIEEKLKETEGFFKSLNKLLSKSEK